jgi:CDP-glucose 4,6-dehydratase
MLDIYRDKKVLVTGHTGFKGTWLSYFLEIIGSEVLGYSLAPNTSPSHFDLLNPNHKSVIGNICDIQNLKKTVNDFKPEIIFHLAAQPLVIESYKDPINTYNTNVLGTLNVLESVREFPSIKAIVVITTDKVYHNREWIYPYRENDQLGGYDMYSSSKACSEILVSSFRNSFFNPSSYNVTHNTLLATARAGNVIGGGDWSENRLIPDIVKATSIGNTVKIRNPDSVRPWQHVLDCLYGYLLLGEKLLTGSAEFATSWNFSPYSFDAKTVGEVAQIAKSTWDSINVEIIQQNDSFHEAGLLKLDNTKAILDLRWKPVWNTEKAIQKTIEWYKEFYINNHVITKENIQTYIQEL